jgi:hypothetical protein
MEPAVTRNRFPISPNRRRRLERYRQKLRHAEVDQRLMAEYRADMAAPIPRNICELVEKLELMPVESVSGASN